MIDQTREEKLQFIGLLVSTLIIVICICIALSYFEFKNNESFDNDCRICAHEHNLTCIEEPFNDNFFRNINNINTTRLNCDKDIQILHDCRICLEESKYNHHI